MKTNRRILNLLIVIYSIVTFNHLVSAGSKGYEYYLNIQNINISVFTDLLLFRIQTVYRYIGIIGLIGFVLYLIWLTRTNNRLAGLLSMKRINPWLLNTIWIIPIAGQIVHFIMFMRFYNTYNQVFLKSNDHIKKLFLFNFILSLLYSILNVVFVLIGILSLLSYRDVLGFKLSLDLLSAAQGIACVFIFRFFRDCEQRLHITLSEEFSIRDSSVIDQ